MGSMATLTTAQRKRMRPSQFGLPERARTPAERAKSGNYPEPDKAHAADAKSRADAAYREGRISRAERDRIVAKANAVLYGGRHEGPGHVFAVPSGAAGRRRGRVKPDGQPSYKMQARIPRRPRAASRQKRS